MIFESCLLYTSFQIREMRETDIAQVEAIEQEIFSVPWSEKSFLSACTTPENIYLVCLAGEEVAGYCGLWSVLGEGNITNICLLYTSRCV